MVKITIQFTLIQYKEDNLKEVILDFLKEFQIRNLESVLNELTKSTYIVNFFIIIYKFSKILILIG